MSNTTEKFVLDNLHEIDIDAGEIGVTVRLGRKWFDRLSKGFVLDKGSLLDLQETIGGVSTIVGEGRPTDLWLGEFRDLPARLIEKEHEIPSRLYSGLLESMRRAYGPEFDETDEVTAFTYERIS